MAFKMHCPKCGGLDFSIERDNRTFGAVAQAYELVFHCRCGKQLFGEVLLKEYEQQKKAFESGEGFSLDTQATPDARVQRIEDRLRSGKKSPAGEDGDGRMSPSDKRWQAQLTKGLDDDEEDEGSESPAPAVARKSKGPAPAKAKPKTKDMRPAKRKPTAAPAAKARPAAASRPKKKAASARPARPTAARSRKKVAPARPPRKDTRRPASARLGASAKTAARMKAAAKTAARGKAARTGAKVRVTPKGRGHGHEFHGTCIWPGCGKPTRANSKYCSRACSNKNARSRHKTRVRKSVTKKSSRSSRSAKGR